jgi:hypothetical protein
MATVSGVVTHNGTPVEGAKVTLHPTAEIDGKGGAAYAAQTDSHGKYLIASSGRDPGIPPGMYKVTVTKLKTAQGNLPPEAADPGQLEAAGGAGGALNALPDEYGKLMTSKLTVTLEPGKNENKNFELKGEVTGGRAGSGVP